MRDQLGKDVVLQAHGGRLHPAQPASRGQQRRRELPKKASAWPMTASASVSPGALITPIELAAPRDRFQTTLVNRRTYEQLHGHTIAKIIHHQAATARPGTRRERRRRKKQL